MIPQKKARELIDRMFLKIPAVYDPTGLPHYPIAKQMALIAVDEVINIEFRNFEMEIYNELDYWNEVKIYILKF